MTVAGDWAIKRQKKKKSKETFCTVKHIPSCRYKSSLQEDNAIHCMFTFGPPVEKRDHMTISENLKIMYILKILISVEQFLKISVIYHKR